MGGRPGALPRAWSRWRRSRTWRAGTGWGSGTARAGRLLGGGPGEVPDRYAAVDPARLLPLPVPVVVVHGTLDLQVPVGIGRDYVAAAWRAGTDARLVELAGVEHFGLIDPLSSAWPAVLAAVDLLAAQGPGVVDAGPGGSA